ncbi:MAG TPA: HD domain-containing protein [candidate division Zixibacteria bacterium]|nr:HD domain-containing protein [candidate division Zixibacteria bacterium]
MNPNPKKLEEIVRENMSSLEGTAHSYAHVERVAKIAAILAEKEKADQELVQTAALLHDIGYAVGEPHNETGAKLARMILEQTTNLPEQRIEKTVKIVLRHPIAFRDKLETLEEKIVWDADKIDLLGVIGIARVFHWMGKKPFETTVNVCLEELKPIYSLLNTPSARKIARERQRRTIASLSALKEELSTEDLRIS